MSMASFDFYHNSKTIYGFAEEKTLRILSVSVSMCNLASKDSFKG